MADLFPAALLAPSCSTAPAASQARTPAATATPPSATATAPAAAQALRSSTPEAVRSYAAFQEDAAPSLGSLPRFVENAAIIAICVGMGFLVANAGKKLHATHMEQLAQLQAQIRGMREEAEAKQQREEQQKQQQQEQQQQKQQPQQQPEAQAAQAPASPQPQPQQAAVQPQVTAPVTRPAKPLVMPLPSHTPGYNEQQHRPTLLPERWATPYGLSTDEAQLLQRDRSFPPFLMSPEQRTLFWESLFGDVGTRDLLKPLGGWMGGGLCGGQPDRHCSRAARGLNPC